MMAHSLHPYPCGIGRQWQKSGVGPFPAGTFGQYMSRNAFQEVSQYLHLSDNEAEVPVGSEVDKLKKNRLLIDMVQTTFPSAYELGRHVSFDEGGIATKSKYAPCTQLNNQKPKSRFIEMFMMCCSQTLYCTGLEFYEGKKPDGKRTDDNTTGRQPSSEMPWFCLDHTESYTVIDFTQAYLS